MQNDRVIRHSCVNFSELSQLYSQIDAVILLQDRNSEAATYQLPSKLFDAMFFSKPVIASNTPVLQEYIHSDFLIGDISISELKLVWLSFSFLSEILICNE